MNTAPRHCNDLPLLWHQYKTLGHTQARQTLFAHYAYLASTTARMMVKCLPQNVDVEDLISEGLLGLAKAIDQFDPARGVKFTTYSIALIRGAILESLRQDDWVPRSVREQAKQVARARLDFETQKDRIPDTAELAHALGWEEAYLRKVQQAIERAQVASLDEALAASRDPQTPLLRKDMLRDTTPGPEAQVVTQGERERLQLARSWLPEREQRVLRLYYEEDLTFKAIGEKMGVSESRAYQLHTQALKRLRSCLQEQEVY